MDIGGLFHGFHASDIIWVLNHVGLIDHQNADFCLLGGDGQSKPIDVPCSVVFRGGRL